MAGTVTVDTIRSEVSTPTVFRNTSGTEIGQLIRAWINFVGSPASITASFNFSSITRNGTGDYTLSFTNSMTDANYAFSGGGKLSTFGNSDVPGIGYYRNTASPASSGSFRINVNNLGSPSTEDPQIGTLMVIR